MNQQQLQIARAALWHQTADAPLRTFDDAARWLDDIGLCLFLPRHTQLPAPAPSFVEACSGAPSVTPPPAAIAEATELVTRLTAERRLVPLNLLGAFSEQPDFLVTLEILPWVAAVRGDRQWKTAPGGRTAPIVLRTWEALDREGELTAVEIREILGRELTEAAILRALIELWTNLRAMPIYGEPLRWTLLKTRFPAQLATAANTAQTTALSVLASLYLRSAVAATAEEAEIFLSPLTARSRIREVLHGMTATRHLGSTTVASQTLLFVEGSLPETLPPTESEPPKQLAPPAVPAPRPPFRKVPRPTRWELPARGARPQPDRARPWQKKPAVPHHPEPSGEQRGPVARPFPSSRPGSRPDSRPGTRPTPPPGPRPNRPGVKPRFGSRPDTRPSRPDARPSRPGARPSFAPRPGRPNAKPWQRRDNAFRKPSFPKRSAGSPASTQSRESRPPREQPWRGKDAAPSQPRPWQKDRPRRDRPPQREERPARDARPAENRPFRPKSARPAGAFGPKPGAKFGPRPGVKFGGKPGSKFGSKFGPKPGGKPGGKFGPRPFGKFSGKPGSKFGRKPAGPGKSAPSRPFRPGKSSPGKPNYPPRAKARPSRPAAPKNKFRKSSPTEPNPRKNRKQKENPE